MKDFVRINQAPITPWNEGNNKLRKHLCRRGVPRKALTLGGSEVLPQPARRPGAVLGVVEGEVVARDLPRVSLRPLTRDFSVSWEFADICSSGRWDLEEMKK